MTTTRGTTFTTTKGVIDRVHNDTTDGRANAEPARAACRTRGFIHVIDIGNLTHDGNKTYRAKVDQLPESTNVFECIDSGLVSGGAV